MYDKEKEMTQFNKEDFNYHGGYLMYKGDYEGRPVYEDGPYVHPSNVGRSKDLFVARFKYRGGPITKVKFLKELIKNFTVEEYAEARSQEGIASAPVEILKSKSPEWYENMMNPRCPTSRPGMM
tara:strand:+ start:4272 stop:4643 length:372 start_codon:yes stop_codon:yes gene_type:complete